MTPLLYHGGGERATVGAMNVGAHVSIAGGFDKCLERASALGATSLQTFASSPRSLKFAQLSTEVIGRYKAKKRELKIGQHFFHGVYLINLASEKADYVQASVASLQFYQELSGRIEGSGTIFHLGSHKGSGFAGVESQIVAALKRVLANTPPRVQLFLENAAGHQGVIGDQFAELGALIEGLTSQERKKVAVCFDTQHAFATGYDLRTTEGLERALADFDQHIDLRYLRVIHANDSKVECGGKRDRHENIGEGFMGEESFKLLTKHPRLKNLPFILEVPGENKSGPRKEDVLKLKKLAA